MYISSIADVRDSLARDMSLSDPIEWLKDELGESVWSKQREILLSIRDNRRTAVHSCHNSGKSWLAARAAVWWIESHAPGEAFVVTTAPTGRQVRAILWREIGRAFVKGNLKGRLNQTEWLKIMPAGNEELVAFGQKPSDMDPSAFQGIHQKFVLVIMDEACGIPVSLWDAADTLISNEFGRILAIGNPDDPVTEFFEVCKPNSGWNVIGVSAYDTPNFTGEPVPEVLTHSLISKLWVQEKIKRWGEDSPMFTAKVLGEFPDLSEDRLIPLRWIRAAQDRNLSNGFPVQLGVDVGGGGDRTVIAVRRGSIVRVLKEDSIPDTMQSAGNVVSCIKSTGAELTKIDEIGIGRGVVDRVSEQGYNVQGINVGKKALDSESFINFRAEAYWGLRERFQDGEIDLDPYDEDLAAQLSDLKYKRTSTGKIQIESKDELRRRGKDSPDKADAVCLAFATYRRKKMRPVWGR